MAEGKTIDVFAFVLQRDPESALAKLASKQNVIDCTHRDGRLIRLLVDGLRQCLTDDEAKGTARRSKRKQLILPEEFQDWRNLLAEARYWKLEKMEVLIDEASKAAIGCITVAFHGTLTFGRSGPASDVNFRRIHRIIISGKAGTCRKIFGSCLNETRDVSAGMGDELRYTCRFYLTNVLLEQAFDVLASHRYR
jgi:hypothetical protein